MKNLYKISIATIGTLGILGTAVLATTGIVNAPNGLVLREKPNKSGTPITTLPNEASVEVIEEDGEWYKVTYNSNQGYAFAEYINVNEKVEEKTDTEENEEKTDTTTTSSKLKVYNIPLITSTVKNELEPNAEITVEKEIKNWSYITVGDVQGWVRTYGLTNETTVPTEEENKLEEPRVEEKKPEEQKKTQEETETKPQPADNSNSEEKAVSNAKGYVAVEYARVRKQASTSSETVTTLTKGTAFTILAETEEWYKITYKTSQNEVFEGYIYKELTTK